MAKDRIGDKCWYQEWDDFKKEHSPRKAGFLRAWSTESKSREIYCVGIVEDAKTGVCIVTNARSISFAVEECHHVEVDEHDDRHWDTESAL